ncbi:MAG: copper amine oxidase N-terminal domain-containing protein [Desulfotomaculaceae bacterium]|nr:copper amine oxidase N-terminal domain-containing protein [Desulfotomaculaceae bacterium]
MDGWPLIFDVPPVIENDRTLVPIRRIVESMGGIVDWYEDGYIDIQKDGHNIYLSIDLPVALVDDEPVYLDVPPRIVDDRTLVPLRFVAETFGLNVEWDESTSSVYLNNH